MVVRRVIVMNEGTPQEVRFRVTARRGEVIVDVPMDDEEAPGMPFRTRRLRFTTDEAHRLEVTIGEAVQVSRT